MLYLVSLFGSLAVVLASVVLIVTMLKGSAGAITDALLGTGERSTLLPIVASRRARRVSSQVTRRPALRAAA